MSLNGQRKRVCRRLGVIVGIGTSVSVLSSCDPTTRDGVLQTIGNAATQLVTTLIQAWVQSQTNRQEPQPITVRTHAEMPAVLT